MKALVSIGLADNRQFGTRYKRPVPASFAFETFEASIDGTQLALTMPATILSLQAAVCVQLFLVSMLRHNAASRLGGLIVRMALYMPVTWSSFDH